MHLLKFFVLITCSIVSFSSFAIPKHIEVWFLMPDEMGLLEKHFNGDEPVYSEKLAQNVCIPYGDQCFDPNIGLYPNPNKNLKKEIKIEKKQKKNNKYVSSVDTDMISCDKNYYFDMFCGQAKNIKKSFSKLEVWIDISTSFRELDPSSLDGRSCKRRTYVNRIKEKCGANMDVFVFDTSFKRVSGLDATCMAKGMNDQKRMMRWLRNSQAKNLLFITDINEASEEFIEFLREMAATIHESKTTAELLKSVPQAWAMCK